MERRLQFHPMRNFVVSTIFGLTIFNLRISAIRPMNFLTHSSRIVNGTEITLHEFPFLAVTLGAVNETSSIRCGGSIIGRRWVITAAHCVFQDITYRVFAGIHDTSQPNDLQQNSIVQQVFIHPEFDRTIPPPLPQQFDIALLLLSNPFEFNDGAQPIPLEPVDYDKNGTATAIGWGATELNGPIPRIARKVNVRIWNQSDCVRRVPQIIDSQLCAGDPGIDVCSGDSGGPLICYSTSGRDTVLCGIISIGDCGRSFFGMYTRITWFLQYIQDTITASGVSLTD